MNEKAPERIVERIRKMLALANDLAATEHERETALRMAYNLLAKYNLELTDVEKKQEPRVDNESKCYGMPWAKQLSNAIAQLFLCTYYIGVKVNATQTIHHFVGRESNAVTAAVMADWLIKHILKECRSRYTHNLCPESRAFATGATERIRERIIEMRRQATAPAVSGSTALVLADMYTQEKALNDKFLAEIGIHLRAGKTRHKGVGGDAYHSGRAFGDKVNLSRQVAQKPSGLIR